MTTRKILTAASIVIISMLLMASGCNGEKGDAGATGATGATGAAGSAGGAGSTPPTNTVLNPYENLPGLTVAITALTGGTGTNGNFKGGDPFSFTFTVKKDNGFALPLSELDGFQYYLSGPTTNYNRVIPKTGDVKTKAVQNADGSYTYTVTGGLPTTYNTPPNYTGAFTDGVLAGNLQDGTYTLGYRAWKDYYVNGTKVRDVSVDSKDFLVGNAVTIEKREIVKTENCNQCHIKIQHHSGEEGNSSEIGRARDARLCGLCHTAGAEDWNETPDKTPNTTVEFKVMIHKIHNGDHLPSVLGMSTNADGTRNYAAAVKAYQLESDELEINDFSDVGFPVWPNMSIAMPKDSGYSALNGTGANGNTYKVNDDKRRKGVTECNKCHGDPDGTGPLTAPSQGNLAYAQPSRRACGACHDDVDWNNVHKANGLTMPVQANDSSCTLCHAGTGANPNDSLDVVNVHKHPLNDSNVSKGAAFTITNLTGGTGGAADHFVAGDTPQITFTLTDDDGTNVPLASIDRVPMAVVGPTNNRQPLYLMNSFPTVMHYDFAGRLAAASTSNKGIMSKVVASSIAATETLIVQFTSTTQFSVTGYTPSGSGTGALGNGTLPGTPSTNPSGSSLSAVILSAASTAQNIKVAFTSATDFTVTDNDTAAVLGTGSLPASTSTSTRFTSTNGNLAFTITVGTTAFAAGNNIYLTVFKGAVANSVIFAIVAGRTSFAVGDRFYYDLVKTAATYTIKMPVDIIPLELLGVGNGAPNQNNLVAANLPVYYGRQSLYERTALAGVATTITGAVAAFGRYVDVTALDAGLAVGDNVVLDNGVAGKEEYAQVGYIDTTGGLKRVWFKMPIRYAHSATAAFQEATLTYRQEGVDYSLAQDTGIITSINAFGLNNPILLTYRADFKFGWKRFPGDALQSVYFPPPMDSPDFDETWGEWAGKTFVDGTYTVGFWGSVTAFMQKNSEYQTYTVTRVSSRRDFLYGATATTVTSYGLFSSGANCNACHSRVMFHGGGYIEAETCVMCHGVAGTEDTSKYSNNSANSTPGITVNYRTMLHKIHMGEELANADTYMVGSSLFNEVVFPAMPGKVKHCTKCHGDTNTAWKSPADRSHPTEQGMPARVWRAPCGSCHDGDEEQAHINIMTDGNGVESCNVCHGNDMNQDFKVEQVHRNR